MANENKLTKARNFLTQALKSLDEDSLADKENQQSSVSEAVRQARSMLGNSSRGGLYRRLNNSERLRAAGKRNASTSSNNDRTKCKIFEFALIQNGFDDEEDILEQTLKKEMYLERGLVSLNENDSEVDIRKKLVECLSIKFPILVTRKQVLKVQIGKGEYNFPVVKKLAGQGLLYIRMKEEYMFATNNESDEDNAEDISVNSVISVNNTSGINQHARDDIRSYIRSDPKSEEEPVAVPVVVREENASPRRSTPLESTLLIYEESPVDINENTSTNNLLSSMPKTSNPIEMLRYLQDKIVKGRALDVMDVTTPLDGETNYVNIDREDLLNTTFDELKTIEDFSITFEVQFLGEEAQDLGGPRREWIRLCNKAIKEKYFDNGYRLLLKDDYYLVGVLFGVALLQNGQIPRYLTEEKMQEIFNDDDPKNECIKEFRRGIEKFQLYSFIKQHHLFLHLLRPSNIVKLNVRKLTYLLKPTWSEERSNALLFEKEVYKAFTRYQREAYAGRRCVTLENILEYVTGTSEEPPLGFSLNISLEFIEVEKVQLTEEDKDLDEEAITNRQNHNFIPTGNTYSYTLRLPRANHAIHLPKDEILFPIYDLSFKNSFFGKS